MFSSVTSKFPTDKEAMNLSKVFPRPASSPAKAHHKRSSSDGQIAGADGERKVSDSGLELTPVERLSSEATADRGRKISLE